MECGGTSSCPHPCRCADGIVDCREKSLINVPSELPDETTELWVCPHQRLRVVQLLFPVVCARDDHMVTRAHHNMQKHFANNFHLFFPGLPSHPHVHFINLRFFFLSSLPQLVCVASHVDVWSKISSPKLHRKRSPISNDCVASICQTTIYREWHMMHLPVSNRWQHCEYT